LPGGGEKTKRNGKAKAGGGVECDGEGGTANRAEQYFVWQGIVILTARGTTELDGQSKAGCESGNNSEKKTESETVADSEHDGVGDDTSKQSQGAMLSAEQVISKVEAAQDIEAASDNADGCDGVVIHGEIVASTPQR
jgi:hypothetical protein